MSAITGVLVSPEVRISPTEAADLALKSPLFVSFTEARLDRPARERTRRCQSMIRRYISQSLVAFWYNSFTNGAPRWSGRCILCDQTS